MSKAKELVLKVSGVNEFVLKTNKHFARFCITVYVIVVIKATVIKVNFQLSLKKHLKNAFLVETDKKNN